MSNRVYRSKARKLNLPIWKQIEAYPDELPPSEVVRLEVDDTVLTYPARETGIYGPSFPVILCDDGSPWVEANLYLIKRTEQAFNINIDSLNSIAGDLVDYCRFLEDHELDFLYFPKKQFQRVTYRYRAELARQIKKQVISTNTAARRINVVVNFYRHLLGEGAISTDEFAKIKIYAPFHESDRLIRTTDPVGRLRDIRVRTTDLAIKNPKQPDPEYIADGGKLKPLTHDEQLWLLEALKDHGNIEMRLICCLALFTGARLQTCCTFRVIHALAPVDDDQDQIKISIGQGTSIDSKNSKQMVLFVPTTLMKQLERYAKSKRAKARRDKTRIGDHPGNYLFLTPEGTPYYSEKFALEEVSSAYFDNPKRGRGVQEFVSRLRKDIQKQHPSFYFRFHDLRATFGMNLTEHLMGLVEKGEYTLHQVRMEVKERMGHNSMVVTDLYLNYKGKLKLREQADNEWEQHLFSIIDNVAGGLTGG